MPKLRTRTIENCHQQMCDATEQWSMDRAESGLSFYVLLNGIHHMLILGKLDEARKQLGKLMFTGALLDWHYRQKHDDYTPVLRLWRVVGLEQAESEYLNAIESLEVRHLEHFRILRQVVEFIRDAFAKQLAVTVAQASLNEHERLLEDGYDLSESYRQFALALKANKEASEALPWMRKALSIQRRVLNVDNANLYVSVNSLASILNAVQEFDESITLYEEAIENRGRLLGLEHPKTLISLASYAFLLNKTKQFEKALPVHKRVLKGRQKLFTLRHPKTLISMYNYANCLHPLGYLTQAVDLFKQCLELRRVVLGAEHRQTMNAQRQYTGISELLKKAVTPLDEDIQEILKEQE